MREERDIFRQIIEERKNASSVCLSLFKLSARTASVMLTFS